MEKYYQIHIMGEEGDTLYKDYIIANNEIEAYTNLLDSFKHIMIEGINKNEAIFIERIKEIED